MWQQTYTPIGDSLALSALVAAIPIFTLLLLLGVLRKPAWMAALVGLARRRPGGRGRLRHAGGQSARLDRTLRRRLRPVPHRLGGVHARFCSTASRWRAGNSKSSRIPSGTSPTIRACRRC